VSAPRPPTAGRSLRSRILIATLAITGAAVVGFGVPLGVALNRIEHDRVVLGLEREASRVLAVVPDETLVTSHQLSIPAPLPIARDVDDRSMIIGVYDVAGRRISGAGPPGSALAATATTTGREQVGTEAGQLVVAVSLRSDQPSSGAVRVAVGAGDVREDERASWLLMAALAAAILLLAGGTAFLLARRLSRPLENLSRNAQLLGEGDFTVRTEHTGVREIDAAGQSLDATAGRLGALLDAERAFSSNASHQLRTPLTALRLNLETLPLDPGSELRPVIGQALAQLDRLSSTVDQLLSLTRDVERPQVPVDLAGLLDDLRGRWEQPARRAGRRLTVELSGPLPETRGSAAGLAHVLDVLVDNALHHGAGEITVAARSTGHAVAIEVRDEGPGVVGDPDAAFSRRSQSVRGHGIGLALARSLVEADGGRLELTTAGPRPVFTIVFPAHGAVAPVDPAATAVHR